MRIETALAALVVVAAAVMVNLYMARAEAQDERAAFESQITLADDDLVALAEERAGKEAELEGKSQELAAAQERQTEQDIAQTFVTRVEAQNISAQLIGLASTNEIAIESFETSQADAAVAGDDYPAVSYSLVATGAVGELIGMLDVIGAAPTARVDKLEFSRNSGDETLWVMSLDLVVVYSESG